MYTHIYEYIYIYIYIHIYTYTHTLCILFWLGPLRPPPLKGLVGKPVTDLVLCPPGKAHPPEVTLPT